MVPQAVFGKHLLQVPQAIVSGVSYWAMVNVKPFPHRILVVVLPQLYMEGGAAALHVASSSFSSKCRYVSSPIFGLAGCAGSSH